MKEESQTLPSSEASTTERGAPCPSDLDATPVPSTLGDRTLTSPSPPPEYEYKQTIIMRTDLNMRKGKMCAQAAHATHIVLKCCGEDPRVKAWEAGPFAKIVVGAKSEQELLDVLKAARAEGMIAEYVIDSGRTEFHGVPTLTCAAIGPDLKDRVEALTKHLKLL